MRGEPGLELGQQAGRVVDAGSHRAGIDLVAFVVDQVAFLAQLVERDDARRVDAERLRALLNFEWVKPRAD
jgi:hypothetical protein